jgi:DNA-damage-inducible protein J
MAMSADAIVKARIPGDVKDRAMSTLESIGLSVSDVIRLTLMRIADEGRLPFAVEVPNRATRKAMAELEAGGGTRCDSAEALFEDLDI